MPVRTLQGSSHEEFLHSPNTLISVSSQFIYLFSQSVVFVEEEEDSDVVARLVSLAFLRYLPTEALA